MPNISETVLHIRDEGLFVAHCVGHYLYDIDNVDAFPNADDAIDTCREIFTSSGLMYAPTYEQAEAVVVAVINRVQPKCGAADMVFYDKLRDQVGSVIAFARDRYLRYNR